MADHDPSSATPTDHAGDFSTWLQEVGVAIRGRGDADVPCGTCTGCCTSSQFVHIAPEETTTLAHIPAALLFPAPGAPDGHVLLGYDEQGRCPMLGDAGCTIYEHRPRTCRSYDCRVLAATGIEETDPTKSAIGDRARRWRFTHDERGHAEHIAVRAAAAFLRRHPDVIPTHRRPATAAQAAALAIEIHELFVGAEGTAPAPATGAVHRLLDGG